MMSDDYPPSLRCEVCRVDQVAWTFLHAVHGKWACTDCVVAALDIALGSGYRLDHREIWRWTRLYVRQAIKERVR